MSVSAAPRAGRRPASLSQIVRSGWARLMETPALAWLGFTGIALGLFCLVLFVVRHGARIGSEGDLMKPATFNIAVGIYVVTVAMLLPSAGFTEAGRRRWVVWSTAVFSYGFALETIQTLRGIDPRFTRVGSLADGILGGVFGFASIVYIVLFILMARQFFNRDRPDADSAVILAIRYGCVSTLGAFAAGIWMIARGGRHTGAAGNILPLHALGFHGLQAVPIVALLLVWSGCDESEVRNWVHFTGLAWLAACAAVAWQTLAGRSVFDVSPATVAGVFLLAVWGGIGTFALWRWVRPPIRSESPDISRTPT